MDSCVLRKTKSRLYAGAKSQSSAGFTIIESLVAIAITTVMAGVIVIIVTSSFKGASNAVASIDNARVVLSIDRQIRENAATLYVPYWASMEIAANDFADQLWQSNIGKHIESVKLIYDSEKIIRGIEVRYLVDNKTFTTTALFSSRALMSARNTKG